MFRRKNNSLPTTSLSLPSGDNGGSFLPSSSNGPDGSGKAIKMDAPVVKAWKTASGFTRGSYYILCLFIVLVLVGVRYLRFGTGSIWMTCHTEECTLEITPPGSRTSKLTFARGQLLSAHAIKSDKQGNFLKFDDSKYSPAERGKNKKGKSKNSYKGPDENGEYRSYAIKFKTSTTKSGEEGEAAAEKSEEDEVPDGDFTTIQQFLSPGEEEGTYMLYMRKFGMIHSKTRVRSMINKVESYVKKRRQKLILKEAVSIPWQAILCLVLGLLGIMLTLLIGQFWDEPPKKHGGPGARRVPPPKKKPDKNSKFYYDTGRPSKYPPGYKKY